MRSCYVRLTADPNPSPKYAKFLDGTLSFIDPTIRRRTLKCDKTKTGLPAYTSSFKIKNTLLRQNIKTSDVTRQELRDPLSLKKIVNPCDIPLMNDPECLIPASKIKTKHVSNPPAIIAKPQQTSSSTTVLTQNIIGYLIKSKNDEQNKEDALFQSMASLVSAAENIKETSIAAVSPNINLITESVPGTRSRPQVSNNNDDIKPEINILESNIDIETTDADLNVDINPEIIIVSNIYNNKLTADANIIDEPQKDYQVEIKEDIDFEEDDDSIAFYV